jgi:3D (Asp-Asp-Asp) domain-containing protein
MMSSKHLSIIITMICAVFMAAMVIYATLTAAEAEPEAIPPEVNTEGLCVYEPKQRLSEPRRMWLTAYCGCTYCCGKDDCITASGKRAKQGQTIAADLSVFPMGTKLFINGKTYIVEDTGVKGNVLDIYFENHADAVKFGAVKAEVYRWEVAG